MNVGLDQWTDFFHSGRLAKRQIKLNKWVDSSLFQGGDETFRDRPSGIGTDDQPVNAQFDQDGQPELQIPLGVMQSIGKIMETKAAGSSKRL